MNDPRPNILIFMTDQQRGGTILPGSGCRAVTPRLDAFRAQSVTFREAYGPAPHCCPSRATFMSGLYPSQHGVWNNVNVGNALSHGPFPGVRLWSEDVRDAGYRLDYSGKWHVSDTEGPRHRGWNEAHVTAAPCRPAPQGPATGEWWWYGHHGVVPAGAPRGEGEIVRPGYTPYVHYGERENPFNDGAVVDAAIDVLRARPRDGAPWCQFVGTLGPHDPYFCPPRFLDLYDPAAIKLPPSFGDRMTDKPALYRRTRGVFDQLSEREHREAIRHYLAFCSYQDELFGRVLDALDASGEAANTAVLYLSDHGDYLGDHGLWCKGLPCFRGAYHVPCVLRPPAGAGAAGRSVDAFVSLADFAPTLLELAGVAPSRAFAGASLAPWLRGETPAAWRDAWFTQSNGNELYGIQRSVWTREWKYVYNGFDYDELYDLAADPDETVNLAGRPEHRERVDAMAARMWRFARAHDDVCVNPYIMVGLAPVGPGAALDNPNRPASPA